MSTCAQGWKFALRCKMPRPTVRQSRPFPYQAVLARAVLLQALGERISRPVLGCWDPRYLGSVCIPLSRPKMQAWFVLCAVGFAQSFVKSLKYISIIFFWA